MSIPEVANYKRRLDNSFREYASISIDKLELRADMARYLCVLVSGFIEVSVRAIYTDYSRRKSIPYVGNFVDARLSNLRNVNMKKLLELTGNFNPTWKTELRAATQGEMADAIDSVVANRNLIAHGNNSGISFVTIKKYYEQVLKVIDLIEQQCT